MSDPTAPLEDALRLSPGNVPLRLYLAGLLAEQGYWARALDHYKEAHKAEPGNVAACLGYGRALRHQGEPVEAVRVLNQALGMDPESGEKAQLHLELSRTLVGLDRTEEARDQYRRATQADPSAADRELLSRLHGEGTEDLGPGSPLRVGGDSLTASPVDSDREGKIDFGDVGGMDALKETLRLAIVHPFKHPEIYRAYGRKIGGGILLYGPPGCGKTYIARATAGEIQARFFSIGLQDIMDMWYGESERKLHELFETARSQSPAVLFFDEVEAMGASRTRMSNFAAGRTLVNQFLSEMDGISSRNENLLIIGATNSPWDLDPAFRRPGRFDRTIFVPPPDQQARVEILRLHLRERPVGELDFERIGAKMAQFSGADIKNVCEAATERGLEEALKSGVIRKIQTADFLEVLKRLRPTTTEWLGTARNYARYSNQSGLYTEVEDYLAGQK